MKNIKLFEHNSSRLLFISTKNRPNIPVELNIVDTTNDVHCTEMTNINGNYPNNWLLGKLTDNIWLIEDCGIYDSNHTHTADIYQLNNGEQDKIFAVTRMMEYGGECDRLYTEHSGSLKFILLDSLPDRSLKANFYIKYERSLPAAIESIGNLQDSNNNIYEGCVAFFRYNDQNNLILTEAIQMIFGLVVNEEELDQNNNPIPMDNINYVSIHPLGINTDFSKISITYTVDPNTSNDVKIGLIGTKSLGDRIGVNNYYGKFLSYRYVQSNDSFVEPSYFLIQPPKNRSWICYRTYYGVNKVGIPVIYPLYPYSTKQKDNHDCVNIRYEGAGLNGYYGELINNTYVYTINIQDKSKTFVFALPKIFTNYENIKYFDNNDNEVLNFDGQEKTIYNELDGITYDTYFLNPSSSIYKIKLEYTKEI